MSLFMQDVITFILIFGTIFSYRKVFPEEKIGCVGGITLFCFVVAFHIIPILMVGSLEA